MNGVAMESLAGKAGIVTGGCGGLGTALCERLAAEGANVVAFDMNPRPMAEGIHCASVDLRDDRATSAALREWRTRLGRLDFVINNAGVDVTAPIDEITVDDWDRVLDVNLRAPFVVAKTAFGVMEQAGGGGLVNIVSTAAKRAWANASAYHASKWGLLGLSHGLHVEGRDKNIRVTAIITGGMRTPFLLDRFPDIDASTLMDPANVANTVAFALQQPEGVVIPELSVMSMKESSWP